MRRFQAGKKAFAVVLFMSCHCLVSFYLLIQAVGWGGGAPGRLPLQNEHRHSLTPQLGEDCLLFVIWGAFTNTCVVAAAALPPVLIAAALSQKQEAGWSCQDIQDVGGGRNTETQTLRAIDLLPG